MHPYTNFPYSSLKPVCRMKMSYLPEELASVGHESIGDTGWVPLAGCETGGQASCSRSRDGVWVSSRNSIHWVSVRSLVRSASIVGASISGASIVGASVLSSTIGVAAGSTTLSSSVATLLLSSVGLVAWAAWAACVACVASVGESTWVCSSGNDGWDARAADIVGDQVGLRRKGSSCYGVEHAFVSAIDEAEEEGQAGGISLALSRAKGSSGDSSRLGKRSLGASSCRGCPANLTSDDRAG